MCRKVQLRQVEGPGKVEVAMTMISIDSGKRVLASALPRELHLHTEVIDKHQCCVSRDCNYYIH